MSLTATTNSSSQTTTGSPQTGAGGTGGASAQSGGVQPGTAASLLSGGTAGDIQMHDAQLSTVSLSSTGSTSSVASTTVKPAEKHHINTPLLGVSVLLIVVAFAMFFIAKHSVKTTT